MSETTLFQTNPGSWLVQGNIVTNELDDPTVYDLTNSRLILIDKSYVGPNPTVGDTVIEVETPGIVANEGIQEQPATVEVDISDSVWHSLYIRGSGTVILQAIELDGSGNILQTVSSSPLTLTTVDQELHINTIIGNGSLIHFDVVTTTAHYSDFFINGVYVNKGDTPRTGQNLVPNNVAFTGQDGSVDGFMVQPNGSNTEISPIPIVDVLEMQYNVGT